MIRSNYEKLNFRIVERRWSNKMLHWNPGINVLLNMNFLFGKEPHVRHGGCHNILKVNADKTEFIWLGTRQQLINLLSLMARVHCYSAMSMTFV
jgi:hypothetical protein